MTEQDERLSSTLLLLYLADMQCGPSGGRSPLPSSRTVWIVALQREGAQFDAIGVTRMYIGRYFLCYMSVCVF